jgi:hypothetical protein
VLGVGWYPNVEVDDDDRLHFAWTDADLGDVLYAVTAPGASTPGPPEPVEVKGAAGQFVHLALAPGGAPVLSYYQQDEHTLRLAHRPVDLARMKAAGVEVGDEPIPAAGDGRMGPGWVGEDIVFGDNAGLGGALAIDGGGRAHVTYYVRGEKLRYARRPADVPAFGGAGIGVFEKLDVDAKAGNTSNLITDLRVEKDGTVVASYCDWSVTDARLKLAVRAPGSLEFVTTFASNRTHEIDGWASQLVTRSDNLLDVVSVHQGKRELLIGAFDARAPKPLVERKPLLSRPGPTVVRRGPDGTLWILTRRRKSNDEEAALTLVALPAGDGQGARRYVLEKGAQQDAWIDLAIRRNGKPVAVWFSSEMRGMRQYAP